MSAVLTVPNIPNPNPTGTAIPPASNPTTAPVPMSTTWGGLPPPPTGGPGNYNFGNSNNPNPTATSTNPFAPTTSMNPGSPGGTQPNSFNLDPRQSGRSLAELQKYYGEGMGSMLFNYLQSGGGYNSAITQQAVDAQIAAMQNQIQRGLGNLDTQMGETGISPNSSTWALETGDYMSNAVAQENAITAQEYFNMWNSSQNRMAEILGKTADTNATGTANEGGFMDFLSFFQNNLSAAGGFAGA